MRNQPENEYFDRYRLLNRPFSWLGLRAFGSSKVVKSSYVWIFAIPIIARSLDNLHTHFQNGNPILHKILSISMPFTWYVLYFSALSFALASVLYEVFCPRIIRQFDGFQDFLDAGYDGYFLADELDESIPRGVVHDSPIYTAFVDAYDQLNKPFGVEVDPYRTVWYGIRKIGKEHLSGIFYVFTQVANHAHPRWLRTCGLFYYVGFGLLFVVLCQNINYVLVSMFGRPLIHVPF